MKRLDAIQNFGSIDILFSDTTGTLTMDAIIIERHCDLNAVMRDEVLQSGFLVSRSQTVLRSALDVAIFVHEKEREFAVTGNRHKVDEVPFDLTRRIAKCDVVVKASCGTAEEGVPHSFASSVFSSTEAVADARDHRVTFRRRAGRHSHG